MGQLIDAILDTPLNKLVVFGKTPLCMNINRQNPTFTLKQPHH